MFHVPGTVIANAGAPAASRHSGRNVPSADTEIRSDHRSAFVPVSGSAASIRSTTVLLLDSLPVHWVPTSLSPTSGGPSVETPSGVPLGLTPLGLTPLN